VVTIDATATETTMIFVLKGSYPSDKKLLLARISCVWFNLLQLLAPI
jgi:hypothetical protein